MRLCIDTGTTQRWEPHATDRLLQNIFELLGLLVMASRIRGTSVHFFIFCCISFVLKPIVVLASLVPGDHRVEVCVHVS